MEFYLNNLESIRYQFISDLVDLDIFNLEFRNRLIHWTPIVRSIEQFSSQPNSLLSQMYDICTLLYHYFNNWNLLDGRTYQNASLIRALKMIEG